MTTLHFSTELDTAVRAFPPDEAQLAAMAFLARYSGRTLDAYRHDLRNLFQWAADHNLAVLEAIRTHLELHRTSMEERGLAASTIDRRLSTACGFYRFAHCDEALTLKTHAHLRHRPQRGRSQGWLHMGRAFCAPARGTMRDIKVFDNAESGAVPGPPVVLVAGAGWNVRYLAEAPPLSAGALAVPTAWLAAGPTLAFVRLLPGRNPLHVLATSSVDPQCNIGQDLESQLGLRSALPGFRASGLPPGWIGAASFSPAHYPPLCATSLLP